MESIKLKVTSNVIFQTQRSNNQEQIAISNPSGSIAPLLDKANKQNKVSVIIAGTLTLDIGDTSAIWRAHNRLNEDAFDALFEFLSRFPDKEFEFICSIV